jgi:hypothetical protein
MCRQFSLLTQAITAIDGSKFKAVNNRNKNFTPHKLEQRMKQIDDSIERYLNALDTADRTQPVEAEAKTRICRRNWSSSGSRCNIFGKLSTP